MKKEKQFDCLKMKDDLQSRLAEEYKGLSDDEIWEKINHKAETSNHPIWNWLRRVQKSKVA